MGRADDVTVLDEAALGEAAVELGRVVGRAQPGPEQEIGARGHGGGGLQRDHAEVVDGREEVARSVAGQQLGPDGDPSGVAERQPVGSHRSVGLILGGPGLEHREVALGVLPVEPLLPDDGAEAPEDGIGLRRGIARLGDRGRGAGDLARR